MRRKKADEANAGVSRGLARIPLKASGQRRFRRVEDDDV